MRLTRRRLIWLCCFNSLSAEKQNAPAPTRVCTRGACAKRKKKRVRALVSHAHIISAHRIIATERIRNHSVIWTVASRTVTMRVVENQHRAARQSQILAAGVL